MVWLKLSLELNLQKLLDSEWFISCFSSFIQERKSIVIFPCRVSSKVLFDFGKFIKRAKLNIKNTDKVIEIFGNTEHFGADLKAHLHISLDFFLPTPVEVSPLKKKKKDLLYFAKLYSFLSEF